MDETEEDPYFRFYCIHPAILFNIYEGPVGKPVRGMHFVLSLYDRSYDEIAEVVTYCGGIVTYELNELKEHSILIVDHDMLESDSIPAFRIDYIDDCLKYNKVQDIVNYRQECSKEIRKDLDTVGGEGSGLMEVVYSYTKSWNMELGSLAIREDAEEDLRYEISDDEDNTGSPSPRSKQGHAKALDRVETEMLVNANVPITCSVDRGNGKSCQLNKSPEAMTSPQERDVEPIVDNCEVNSLIPPSRYEVASPKPSTSHEQSFFKMPASPEPSTSRHGQSCYKSARDEVAQSEPSSTSHNKQSCLNKAPARYFPLPVKKHSSRTVQDDDDDDNVNYSDSTNLNTSRGSDDGFGWLSKTTGKAKAKKRLRRGYTYEERCTILKYIIKHGEYSRIKGREMWIDMESTEVLPDRTWQSLKEHYLKKIVPNLNSFHFLTDKQKKSIKKYAG